MKKIILLLIFPLLNTLLFAQQNNRPIPKQRPADYEYLSAPDSTGKRTLLKTAVSHSEKNVQSNNIKLPYPIIFIHGLNSNADTWAATANFMISQYGLAVGGRFDYCLNYDGNNTIANTNFYPTANADIAVFTGTWIAGDFYYVNFDVGNDGVYSPAVLASDQVWSNQSAVAKQGMALRDAIYRVLQLTGREKVILMGHSMGGLAAREYLQNPNI